MIMLDEPRLRSRQAYEMQIERGLEYLTELPGLLSVYQVGGVGTPGISDIDLVAVFEDDVSISHDPRKNLDRYLFTHPLFGAPLRIFEKSKNYAFFHNATLLHGEDVGMAREDLRAGIVKDQWRIEFLLKCYINLSVWKAYDFIKVRSLLLNVRALEYDLGLDSVDLSELQDQVQKVLNWREAWFVARPTDNQLLGCFETVLTALERVLGDLAKQSRLRFEIKQDFKINHNIHVKKSSNFYCGKAGFSLPILNPQWSKKINAINVRLSKVTIGCPIDFDGEDGELAEFFEYNREAIAANKLALPRFMPLASSFQSAQ